MKIVLLLNLVGRLFCTYTVSIQYTKTTWPLTRIRMNGYDTFLHIIALGKYIVIKVEYGLQLHFKIFLNKSDRKHNNKKIIKMLMILDFKILSL